jgi:hypothetical protein
MSVQAPRDADENSGSRGPADGRRSVAYGRALTAYGGRLRKAIAAHHARTGGSPARTLHRLLLGAGGLAAMFWAQSIMIRRFPWVISGYDEGVLLTNANQLLWGQLPYRDFYTNYPPGMFLVLAAGFKLAGVSVGVERTIGYAIHWAVALGAGRVAGRLLGEPISLPVAGLVLAWLAPLGVISYAWLASLAVALLACEAWAQAHTRGRRWGYVVAGITLGVSSWFRHDLFVYLGTILGGCAAFWVGRALLRRDRAPLRIALWTALGTVLSLYVLWLPVFAVAGFRRVAADLYFDQVRHVMPARVMPLPPLLSWGHVGWTSIELPAFLRAPFEGAVWLVFCGLGLSAAALLFPRAAGLKNRSHVVWPAALGLAVAPQMLGRTDFWHAIFAVPPALIWGWVWLHGGPERRSGLGTALASSLAAFVLLYLPLHDWRSRSGPGPQHNPPELARAGMTPVDAARKGALDFITRHTQPGDPIYVGLTDHRWTLSNDMDLYFLSDRIGATRYMQFDPNIVNREDVQRGMIADLERTRPRVAILMRNGPNLSEPNESQNMGSSLIDEYLRSHYAGKGRSGNFVLRLRK